MLEESPWPLIAMSFSVATVVISVFQICQHLRNYTEPSFQRFIIRIVFLVPSYSVASYLAVQHRDYSIFYETPRDCYEAWVIYNFMSLCMAYIGGPGAVVVKCEGKVLQPSWTLMTCCMAPIPVDGFFLRKCKQGTLQFVIIKPILAVVTLALFICGKYQVSNWSWDDGYPYVTFIYNICYALALFWLLLLYVGTDELLKPYKPLLKFLCFKAVIFLTFWQSLLISFMAPRLGIDPDNAEALQNWVIVAEMFVASVGMLFAFPWSEYQIGGTARGWSWDAFTHAVSIMDVVSDILHQFNPSYGSYVLYHDGGPEKNVKMKKYRGGEKDRHKEREEFSGATSATTQMPRRGRRRGVLVDHDDPDGNEDGSVWSGAEKPHSGMMAPLARLMDRGRELSQNTGQQLVSWIPGITEEERNQAELLDSDSDAAYDEENVRDNQIDDDMLFESNVQEQSALLPLKTSTFGGGGTDEESLARIEAAFGFPAGYSNTIVGGKDSTSRVEAAFAEAFGAAATAPAAKEAPAAAATPTATANVVVLPQLAPPLSAKPSVPAEPPPAAAPPPEPIEDAAPSSDAPAAQALCPADPERGGQATDSNGHQAGGEAEQQAPPSRQQDVASAGVRAVVERAPDALSETQAVEGGVGDAGSGVMKAAEGQ